MTISKLFGVIAYGFGAFIPGGTIISEPLSWVVKHTNRIGKLIKNHGSKLEDREMRDTEKEKEKARKRDKKIDRLKDDDELD